MKIGEKVPVETGYGTVWSWKYRRFLKNPIQYLLWAFFGNDDQGCIPKKHAGKPWPQGLWGFILWWIANPAHNWARYVVGFGQPAKANFPGWEEIPKEDLLEWKPRKYKSFEKGLFWVKWKYGESHPTSIALYRRFHPFLTRSWFYIGWRSDAALAARIKL